LEHITLLTHLKILNSCVSQLLKAFMSVICGHYLEEQLNFPLLLWFNML
jgi:hypothetical protein